MIAYLICILGGGAILFSGALYLVHLGKKEEQEKQIKDIMNESIKAKQGSVKRSCDPLSSIRDRMSKYARKD